MLKWSKTHPNNIFSLKTTKSQILTFLKYKTNCVFLCLTTCDWFKSASYIYKHKHTVKTENNIPLKLIIQA